MRGYPTLLILDQEGAVREMYIGDTPGLRENVVKSVERLLKSGGKP